ncbi:MAG: transglutaminase family protein [Planctomycetota bacterium]
MTNSRSALRRWILPSLCLSLLACACDRREPQRPLANAGKQGLSCSKIEDVFALAPDEIDLGSACLLADREVDAALDLRACIERLDQLAHEFLWRGEPDDSIEETLQHLVAVAAEAPRSGEPIEYEYTQPQLARVIDHGKGNCVSLSALYLAIAERAGLDLRGVLLPYHFKVRHERPDGVYEIETTNGRISRGRDDAIARYFSERDRSSSRFGETLSPRDTLAHYVAECGNRLHRMGGSARGLELCQLAIAACPDLLMAHVFVGDIETEFDATSGKGIAAYQRALEIRPDDAYIWLRLANAYIRSGSCPQALTSCSKALALDRDLAPGWLRLAEIHLCVGSLDDGLAACRTARELRPERMHVQDSVAIAAFYGDYRHFEAETYRTESRICAEFSRRYSGKPPTGMALADAMLQTELWLSRSNFCTTLACPELFPLETGRWAYQSATERMRADARLAADSTLIELAKAASAHLKAIGAL